jgi:anti-sigma factor (TIGR02949 family)
LFSSHEVRTLFLRRLRFHEPPAFFRIHTVSDSNQPGWTCEDVMARLLEHLDGELPPELDTWIREHLAVCNGCLARTGHQRAFLRALRVRRGGSPATEALRARIERSLRGGERSERGD